MNETQSNRLALVLCFAALVFALLGAALAADAATVSVPPTQTLASAIANAAAGDTLLIEPSTRNEGIALNKSLTVKANGLVTLRPGAYTAISIQASNCAVIGFTAEGFSQAVAGTGRTNVTLQDLKFTNAGAGIWINGGSNWLVERVDLEFRCRDGEDYMNVLSFSGLTVRRCYFHGLRIPGDLGTGPNYKHSDLIQTWVTGGTTGLKNALIEENIFTDYLEGVYLNNEDFTLNAVNNITVRNNVFWGINYPPSGGNAPGTPGVAVQYTGPANGTMVIKNNIIRIGMLGVRLYNQSNVAVEGNIFDNAGASYSFGGSTTAASVKRGTLGNVLWQPGWDDMPDGPPDKTLDPQYQNAAAIGAAVVGPDGIPWTVDDAWVVKNAQAALYGPQILLGQPTPPDPVPPQPGAVYVLKSDFDGAQAADKARMDALEAAIAAEAAVRKAADDATKARLDGIVLTVPK